MTRPNDPAFLTEPKTFYMRQTPPDCDVSFGLTKREYFAAMALLQEFADMRQCNPAMLAKLAVETADALIAELNK